MSQKWFDAELEEEDQKIAALLSNAAAFQAKGGSPLMLTEAVENGNDAIEENRRVFGLRTIGEIQIIVNNKLQEIMVIDNGTGLRFPIHVIKKPFKSLKKNIDYLMGEYGRGLQGFRGFCTQLVFISRRKEPSPEEVKEGFDSRTVSICFVRDRAGGNYRIINDAEFEKYCPYETGTVAIYRDWLPGEFEKISAKIHDLTNRIQHHFGELMRKGTVKITIQTDDEVPTTITPRTYNASDRYPMESIDAIDKATGQQLGKIEFYLYKTAPAERYPYKRPFILVHDRPLQDSFLVDFPEFQDQTVWASNYITGYVKCDFVKPNQLRLALEPSVEKDVFVRNVQSAGTKLRKMVKDFRIQLENVQLKHDIDSVVLQVQRFLKEKNVFQFKKMVKEGLFEKNLGMDRIGMGQGNDQLLGVNPLGTDSDTIMVATKDLGLLPGTDRNTERGKDRKTYDPNREGIEPMNVKIDASVMQHVQGRKIRQKPTGPGMVPEENELTEELSWFEDTIMSVVINTAHERFRRLRQLSMKSGAGDNVYRKKLETLIAEQYLWWIVKKFSGRLGDDMDRMFWNLKYEYFENH